jgi:hypothetical protein
VAKGGTQSALTALKARLQLDRFDLENN